MTHAFPKPLYLAAILASVGCAHTAPQVQYVQYEPAPRTEALAIEAARHHPNAQPRERPLYPEQAPPPLAQGASLPPPAYITRRAQPQLAQPPYDDGAWSARGSSYSDFAPSYDYPYGYGYYAPAYPTYGYRLGYGVGWRANYGWRGGYRGWGPRFSVRADPWPSGRYHGFDGPRFHGHEVDHHHGDFRPSFGGASHESFHGSVHGGSRQPRTDIRVHR